ncbi:exodeoxyribonuclease VII small subunit [Castellaniella sp.]|uniref:exodeoxyribonuclease VII small subunit n=1 Tax=Castellaniella sp. TaxID=1955812 RepID=UPI002AFF7693|nr:exodeoxyribonuclease VII small subunit [Castellaniella sp.]
MVKEKTAPRPDASQAPEALPADFESALAELESLAARMGDGNLGLEESIALYQRGVALARVCQQRLDAAEQQVQVLQGQLLEPFQDPQGRDAS